MPGTPELLNPAQVAKPWVYRAVELIEVIEELQAFLAEFGIGPLIETKI